ncbi:MAG: single-stranded-DNA-specific exonuclease RecJ [Candidatus Dojkabacteria bacterium]|jgi:single-stranded-DNA-specific exonuclease
MTINSKSNWILPKKTSLEELIPFLLERRGIEDSESFLNPSLSNIPSSDLLFDTKRAAKEILDAAKKGKKVVIHGDFDADGISSVSILWEFLFEELATHIGKKIDVVPYIPSRVDQGYGLSQSSLEDILSLEAKLVITVDCGIRDRELIEEYMKERELNFIVTDHHQPPEDLKEDLKYTIVHPMFPRKEYPEVEICGSFVVFLLIQAIRKEAGMEYEIRKESRGLDLVALATVTDLMPLVGVNRTLVYWGLKQIREGVRVGMNELVKVSGLELKDIDSYHLGYILGPRVNAAGRIGSSLDGVRLFVSKKENVCKSIANILNETNYQRQFLTESGIEEAEEIIGDRGEEKLLFLVSSNWHEGIVGLIAGKLNEKYHRVVLAGTDSNGEIRASARSIKGFNITEALSKCDTYLKKYGGHQQAAGFTLDSKNVKRFSECIKKVAEDEITDEMLIRNINIDLLLSSNDISRELIEKIDLLKPFGNGNPKPLIALVDLVVLKKQIMGKLGNHMKLICRGDGVDLITLILFNCSEDINAIDLDDRIDVVGSVGINSWNGNEEVQFLVKEWKFRV